MVGGVRMNIHFIDTSVFANILDIPNMNADRKLVIAEFNKLIKSKNDRLILPYMDRTIGNWSALQHSARFFSAFLEEIITRLPELPDAYY